MAWQFNFQFLYVALKDNESLCKWLIDVGLIADKYICPKCNKEMSFCVVTDVSDGFIWRCQRERHSVKRSLRRNTWFQDSKLSLKDILAVTYMWCLNMTNDSIIRDLNLGSRTVVEWKSYCRDVCMELCVKESEKLGGQDVIVEIDECQLEKRKSKGRRVGGNWVFLGIERGTSKCFVRVVNECSKHLLLDVIKQFILPGSIIISDCWKAYNCLKQDEYVDFAKNNSVQFKAPEIDAQTSMEGTWKAVKRSLGASHVRGQFNSYLYEHLWRRHHQNDKNIMMSFLEAIKEIYPPLKHD